ncbi:MAG: type II toxin-antitoxin system RelE family toxin [Gammaproteobacteria bacterium]
MAYTIAFAKSVVDQLRGLTARQRTVLFDAIERQLVHEPMTEVKNRKPLRPNPIAPWELRIGDLHVFYEVAVDEPDTVRILAVGQKKGNTLFIAGKEIKL